MRQRLAELEREAAAAAPATTRTPLLAESKSNDLGGAALLCSLRDQGVITQEEFMQQIAGLLPNTAAPGAAQERSDRALALRVQQLEKQQRDLPAALPAASPLKSMWVPTRASRTAAAATSGTTYGTVARLPAIARFQCVPRGGIAYRNSPAMDDTCSLTCRPYDVVEAVAFSQDGTWIRAKGNGKWLPVFARGVRVLRAMSEPLAEQRGQGWLRQATGARGVPRAVPRGRPPTPDPFFNEHIDNHAGFAWFVCCCCFWPAGLMAICASQEVDNALRRGDHAAARQASANASKYANCGCWFGVLLMMIVGTVVGLNASNSL
jgi:hypothetical protein